MTVDRPDCMICKHFHYKNKTALTCDAFPDRIPTAIIHGFNHRKAYKGDNGIRFEPVPEGEIKVIKG